MADTARIFSLQRVISCWGWAILTMISGIALLTSIGVAGVPSASLVAIAIILAAIGLPMEAIGVLMVFDRILDMCRTSINVWGDCCCATIVARLEGEHTNVALEGPPEPSEEAA